MPRKRAVGKVRRHTEYEQHLQHGSWCQLNTGIDPCRADIREFGEGANFREAEAREVWDAIGTELMALFAESYPSHTPWALEIFGPPRRGKYAA